MAPKAWPETARLGTHADLKLAEGNAGRYYNVHIQSVVSYRLYHLRSE